MSVVDEILRREGGFVNRPADRGGPTNFGITRGVLSVWRNRPVSIDDVRNLTEREAREIYQAKYIQPFEFVAEPQLRHLLIDSGVNHGVGRAIQWLQQAVGVSADGKVGPVTRAALLRQPPAAVYTRILRRRVIFYGQIITSNPSQAEFAHGWARRVAEFIH
jgi:lysozyme family protein